MFAGVRKPSDGDNLVRAWKTRQGALAARSRNLFFSLLDRLTGKSYVPGGDITWILLDVAKPDTIAKAAAEVERAGGKDGIYAVFANAGINAGCAFELETLEEERATLDVNFYGALETARAFMPMIRRNGRGRLVFTGSLAGIGTSPMAAACGCFPLVAFDGRVIFDKLAIVLNTDTASKHALYAATDSIRMEMAPFGIAVSTMEPGEIQTEIWTKQRSLVDKMLQHPLRSVYEGHIRAFAASMDAVASYPGVPAWYCSISLLHALGSPFPMPRYPVGFGELQLVSAYSPSFADNNFSKQIHGLAGSCVGLHLIDCTMRWSFKG